MKTRQRVEQQRQLRVDADRVRVVPGDADDLALLLGEVLQREQRADRGERTRARSRACRSSRGPRTAARCDVRAMRIAPASGSEQHDPGVGLEAHPLQLPQLVDVDRQAPAVDGDDQAEADGDLAGGDDHHDEREDLAVLVAVRAREGDEREVRRVEHQLEAEQDHERVAAHEHAAGADAEDQRREDEVPLDAHRCGAPSGLEHRAALGVGLACPVHLPVARNRSATRAARAASSRPARRRASTTAPTAATSSRNDATSKASRNVGQQQLADLRRRAEAGEPAARPPRRARVSPVPSMAIDELDEQRDREQRARPSAGRGRAGRPDRVVRAADVGDDEDVEHHHRADVDDHLRRGDELRAQQQEQRRERQQVDHEREHRVERVAQGHGADRAREGADRGEEEEDLGHRGAGGYSPAARSGVRSSGSASSISLVKMRSERL